jgi:hypothetical protein
VRLPLTCGFGNGIEGQLTSIGHAGRLQREAMTAAEQIATTAARDTSRLA